MAFLDKGSPTDLSSDLSIDEDTDNHKVLGYAEDENADEQEIREESLKMHALVDYIQGEYQRSKNKRRTDEERWLECYRNYRGVYGPDTQFTSTEKSRAFVKITKTKVLAAYAQVLDILFGAQKFPLGVEHTPVPEGILESVHWDEKAPKDEDVPEEPKELARTTVARKDILDLVGPLKSGLKRIKEGLKEGAGLTPTAQTWDPAKEAAKLMEKHMLDQLEEAGATKSLRSTIFEMCLFGAGAYKGPFAYKKEYPKWDKDGKYKPTLKTVPDFSHVSIWDIYPDADARNADESELFIQRHRMNRSQLRQLKKRPMFRNETIEQVIADGPSYIEEYWESLLREDAQSLEVNRWEVLEFWGVVDKDIAEEAGLEIPEELKEFDQIQINAWICGDKILRIVLNPFNPVRIPYHIVPYEINPYSIFGVGIAENMFDTQLLMNGFMRLAVDNSILSSNLVLEVNETNLVPGQNMDVYPGKIFRTNGQLGQSIHPIKFDNITQECLLMFDKARQLADESTGMPSYAHGMSGVMSTGRTAAGMSMLMGAAKENIKSVVRNVDDYLLIPLGKALFAFNMQFNFKEEFTQGDLEVVARGTESLMRNEVRSQKLLQFYQLTSNPMDMPWVKRDFILRELAISLDLDPEKVVNDQREASIQAKLLQEVNKEMGVDPNTGKQGALGSDPSGGAMPQDPTGTGGGIGPGAAPEPGAPGHTGAGGGANGGNPPQSQGPQQGQMA